MSDELNLNLFRLQRRQRILEVLIGIITIFWVATAAIGFRMLRASEHPQSLTLRRLNIVDDKGISRVILAAPAPAPTYFGKTGHRDGPVSGILLADANGTERGGYVTSDGAEGNALLTLDASGKQTVLLLAEPDGSTLFRLWDKGNGSVTMGSSDTGPFLNVRKGDDLFLSAPKGNAQSMSAKPLYR